MNYNNFHKIKAPYLFITFFLILYVGMTALNPAYSQATLSPTNGNTHQEGTGSTMLDTKCMAPESKYIWVNQQSMSSASVRWKGIKDIEFYNVQVIDISTNTPIFEEKISRTKITFTTPIEAVDYDIKIQSICGNDQKSDWKIIVYHKTSSIASPSGGQGILIVDNDTIIDYGSDIEPPETETDTLNSEPINTLEADLDTEINKDEGLESDSLIRSLNVLEHHHSSIEIKNVLSLDSTIIKHALSSQSTNNHARVSQSETAILLTVIDEYETNSSPIEQTGWRTFTNPFTQQIRLEYSVSEANTPINIYLYNTNGQIVATLLDNAVKNQGIYHLEYNSTSVPKGIYLAILQTTTQQKIIKLTKVVD